MGPELSLESGPWVSEEKRAAGFPYYTQYTQCLIAPVSRFAWAAQVQLDSGCRPFHHTGISGAKHYGAESNTIPGKYGKVVVADESQ